MNPFVLLLDQSSALSAHAGSLANLRSRVCLQLSKPPRVPPDEYAALYDAQIEAQESAKAGRTGSQPTTGRPRPRAQECLS
jgi:hypothetical protein